MSAIWLCEVSNISLGLAYNAGITVKMCKLGTSLHDERCMHICEIYAVKICAKGF